eukprot:462340-Rhodomonas_salina.1
MGKRTDGGAPFAAVRPSKRRKKSLGDRSMVAETVARSSAPPAAQPTAAAKAGPGESSAALRKELGVEVVQGRSACAPVETLTDLEGRVNARLLGLLMGLYKRPTPVQAQTWPLLLR